MMTKVHRLVQQELRQLAPDQPLTVILRVADVEACQSFLDEKKSEGTTLSYNVARLFDTIVLSAPRQVVELLAEREGVIDILPNLEIGLPRFGQTEGPRMP